MKDDKMYTELKENGVIDNPFDVMMHHSLELTRGILFSCHRLKNPDVPEQVCINKEKIEAYTNKIQEELSKLMNMSDEVVAMCRETSYYYQRDEFEAMNKILLELERNMQTVYSQSVPSRNDRFEQIRLGKDSDEYKRILELRILITDSKELSSMGDNDLRNLYDVISRPDVCVKYWMTQEELEEKQKIIERYNLTENDIEYMISYRNSKK